MAPNTVAASPREDCLSMSLRPFAETSLEFASATKAARSHHTDEALKILSRMKTVRGEGTLQPPATAIDYLRGRLLEDAGRLDEAARVYASIRTSYLSDMALYREGMIRLGRGDVVAARVAFADISRASSDWIQARLALSEALTREGRPSLAGVVLKDLLSTDLPPGDLHRARIQLARVRQANGDLEGAIECASAAYLTAPTTLLTRDAADFLSRSGHPVDRVTELIRTLVRGDSESQSRLARWGRRHHTELLKLDEGLLPAIEGAAIFAAQRNPGKAIAKLRQALDLARQPTLRAFTLYTLANALTAEGEDEEARPLLRQVLAEFPKSPFAGLATILSARTLMRLADYEGAVRALRGISQNHPDSGLDSEARWEMALAGLTANRPDAALVHLDEAARLNDAGEGVLLGLAEKIRYFRGVVLHQLGRSEEGLVDLRRVARNYPHSYYSVMAVSRLREWTGTLPQVAVNAVLMGEMASREAPLDDERSLRVCGPALGPFLLWRMGFTADGIQELRSKAMLGLLSEDGLVLLATLLADRRGSSGAWTQDFLRGFPSDDTEDLFALAYPRKFTAEVDEAAQATGVDPALLYGVIRAESRFNSSARSPVGAVGLMQLMPSSARMVARQILAEPKLAHTYYRPDVNILLGSALLGELGRHFDGNLPLMLTGYNAGSGAARKFYKRMHHLSTDVFVEAMPYSVTSAYVKKVIAYTAGYRALYDRDRRGPLTLQTRLPAQLGPYMKKEKRRPQAMIDTKLGAMLAAFSTSSPQALLP